MKKEKKLTVITIRSNQIDGKLLNAIKKQFKKTLPKGHKVALIGVGSEDSDTVTL
jgi:hypothetical protein